MEELRLQINDWIRSCGLFDYMFDADAVVRIPTSRTAITTDIIREIISIRPRWGETRWPRPMIWSS